MPLRQYDPGLPQAGLPGAAWEKQAALMLLGALATFLSLAASVPAGLVLPIFSVITLALGGGIAGISWYLGLRRKAARITCWDIAGTWVFIGLAAAVLADHRSVVDLSVSLAAPPH
jgi:hypothetical protein